MDKLRCVCATHVLSQTRNPLITTHTRIPSDNNNKNARRQTSTHTNTSTTNYPKYFRVAYDVPPHVLSFLLCSCDSLASFGNSCICAIGPSPLLNRTHTHSLAIVFDAVCARTYTQSPYEIGLRGAIAVDVCADWQQTAIVVVVVQHSLVCLKCERAATE